MFPLYTSHADSNFVGPENEQLSRRKVGILVAALMVSSGLFCFMTPVSEVLLLVTYLSLIPLGLWLFYRAVKTPAVESPVRHLSD